MLKAGAFDDVTEAELEERYGSLLSSDEQARHRRYLRESSRRQHLLARALLRTTLSRYADVAPRDWQFETNDYGKPFISGKQVDLPLAFNLSHTDGMLVCLVAREPSCGVDVECTTRRADTLSIAERFFSPLESAALRSFSPAAQRDRFFAYWTLKEAYIKARGMGLALPLAAFSFLLEDEEIRIAFDSRIADVPEDWRFSLTLLSDEHLCAAALRCRDGIDPTIRHFTAALPARA